MRRFFCDDDVDDGDDSDNDGHGVDNMRMAKNFMIIMVMTIAMMMIDGGDNDDDNDDDGDDIYIMMKCLSVCNEKSSLPPVSLM